MYEHAKKRAKFNPYHYRLPLGNRSALPFWEKRLHGRNIASNTFFVITDTDIASVIRLLECVLALDRYRSFARAAEYLNISQPTLTRSIQELERQFDATLFDRDKRTVMPTQLGLIVIERARRVVLDINEIKREVALLKGLSSGDLTIGSGPLVAQTFLGLAAGKVLAKHPMLNLRIVEFDWWDIGAALHERRVDIALGETEALESDPDLHIEPLPQRPVCFFCRVGHPLQRLKRVSIRDIGEFPFIGPKLPKRAIDFLSNGGAMGEMAESGQYFSPRIQCQNLHAAALAVSISDAIGVATRAKIKPMLEAQKLAIIPFQAQWLHTNYAIIYLKHRTLSPAAAAFCAEAKDAERLYNAEAARKTSGSSKLPAD